MSDAVVHITEKNFQSEVMESRLPVLVDFTADWCPPCHALEPVLEEIAKEKNGKIKICRVDVEEEIALASLLSVRNLPFMAFFKNGQRVGDLVGNQPKKVIVEAIDKVTKS